MSGFELTTQCTGPLDIPIRVYKSRRTGIRVITANVEKISSGLVNGYFTLATESDCDDGCPHTLEHIVFMGSDSYPYKGVLDQLANRCYAQGTNAWTDTDHTAYTITTAGAEGFLQILPVYIDHILAPTITNEAFHTEVHHIDGSGEDAGVVYSEMQGRENSAESRMFYELQRTMFAGTGYAAETGGRLKDLRELTADTVRSYHKSYYRPDNLCVIVTGDIEADAVFAALEPVEKRLEGVAKLPPMERPFSKPVPDLTQTQVKRVDYPDSDESVGQVYVSWRECDVRDINTRTAMSLLWAYLTETAVAPLQAAFVESEDPICSDVSMFTLAHKVTASVLCFTGVDVDKLDEVLPKMKETLEKVAAEGLNMSRMNDIVGRRLQKTLNELESNPHNTLSNTLIWYFLYGQDQHDLEAGINVDRALEHCKALTEGDWANMLNEYVIRRPYVAVIGRPSAALGDQMREDEKARVDAQRASLGDEALARLEEELERAMQVNDAVVPDELLASFRVPDASKIHTIKVDIGKDGSAGLPFKAELFDVKSDFAQVSIYADTTKLDATLRPWLELYKDIAFELPVRKGDTVIPYEDFVMMLEANTVGHGVGVGVGGGSSNFSSGPYCTLVKLSMKAHHPEYTEMLEWIKDALWHTEFTPDRLRVSAQRMLSDVPSHKRNGSGMAACVLNNMHFKNRDYNAHAGNVLRQAVHLTKVLERLESEPEAVVADMNRLRAELWTPERMHVQVIADRAKLPHAIGALASLASAPAVTANANGAAKEWRALPSRSLRSDQIGGYAVILPLAAIESSFLYLAVDGISTYTDEDLPALKVLTEYLTAAEGALWRTIRGKGLAYGYSLYTDVEGGLLYFGLSRSANLAAAFQTARDVFQSFLDGSAEFEHSRIEAAQSGCISGEVSKVETMAQAAAEAFKNVHCRGLGGETLQSKLAKIQGVTRADLSRIMHKYLAHVFDPKRANVSIATSPAKADQIKEAFIGMGYNVRVLPEDQLEKEFED